MTSVEVDELKNPYRPGAGTSPPALLDRVGLIDHVGTAVRRTLVGKPGKSFMPIGLRGVGKTVLLDRLAEIAEQEGLAVGFIEAAISSSPRVKPQPSETAACFWLSTRSST